MHDLSSIRHCGPADVDAIGDVINTAAIAYAGVIPADRYRIPYMPMPELRDEIEVGVRFWGWFDRQAPAPRSGGEPSGARTPARPSAEQLLGVMGMQTVDDVTLIRHAYVLPAYQRRGIGRFLLSYLSSLAPSPLLVGTWADAVWAVRFYERNGFAVVTTAEKDQLLRRYWSIPERQVETSVVLRRIDD